MFGHVQIGTHQQSQSKRAIKVIKKKKAKENEMFFREIAIMKHLDHPHICKIFESFEDQMHYYVVLELCSGGELFELIEKTETGFNEKDSAHLSKQMIQAVLYMHQSCIVHRDLKPENFLFHGKGPLEDSILKLIDFGLSTPFRDEPLRTLVGTPFYMAPEVMTKKYGPECDNWSIGILIYVFICGYAPWIGETDKETFTMVKTQALEFDPEEWANISDSAKELITSLLNRTVKQRLPIKDALAHPWMTAKTPATAVVPFSATLGNSLQRFRTLHPLKKAALHVISAHLQESDIENFKRAFKTLDTDGDGLLSADEVKAGMVSAGLNLTAEELKVMIEGVDCTGCGRIEYTEFLAAVLDTALYTQQSICKEAFAVFDRDRDGKLSPEELRLVLHDEGLDAASTQIQELIKPIDLNGDGAIDFVEFMAMMIS